MASGRTLRDNLQPMWSQNHGLGFRGIRPRPQVRRRVLAVPVCVLVLTGCAGEAELGATIEQMLDAGPGRDSSTYRAPEAAENDELARAVLANLAGNDDAAVPDGTRVLRAVDGGDGPVQVVTEDLDDGKVQGLGLYAVRDDVDVPPELVIEVPHPRADLYTEHLGSQLFTALDAEALFVAGAHRTAGDSEADVAHERASTFAAVDRAVVGAGTVVLQVHGFDDSSHEGSAQVVLSSGEATPDRVVLDLAEALEDAGIDTCVYDGDRCPALAGTKNVQAAHARAVGATFIHLELARDLRESGPRREQLVDVLAEVLAR